MKLIVGLGNPGNEYINTRHNVGFTFVDKYLQYKNILPNWKNKFNGLFIEVNINGEKIIFLKPQTYMNLSGESVYKFVNFYKIKIEDILVISDDLDLNIGSFKLKLNGSSGGHNGLKNIINLLGSSEFKRLKIGISKNKDINVKDYVLGKILKDDISIYDNLFSLLYNVLDDFFVLPFSVLMNKYNRKNR